MERDPTAGSAAGSQTDMVLDGTHLGNRSQGSRWTLVTSRRVRSGYEPARRHTSCTDEAWRRLTGRAASGRISWTTGITTCGG